MTEEDVVETLNSTESTNEVFTKECLSIVDVFSLNEECNFGVPHTYYEIRTLDEQKPEISYEPEPTMQMLPSTVALMKRKSLYYMGLKRDRFLHFLQLAKKKKLKEVQVMLTLRKLRLKEEFEVLGDLFDLDKTTAEKFFQKTKYKVADLVHMLTSTTTPTTNHLSSDTSESLMKMEQCAKVEPATVCNNGINERNVFDDVEASAAESSDSSIYYDSEADPDVIGENLDSESCTSEDYSDRSFDERLIFSNIGTLTCGLCWKKFETNMSLKNHQKTIHHGGYLCDLCGKKFQVKKSIKRHILTIHAKVKRFCCGTCGERFHDGSALRYHKKVAHLNRSHVRNFECNLCDMKYFNQNALDVHIRAKHTYKAPFECKFEDCGKTFVRAYNCKVHERSHAEDKFVCDICSKEFSFKPYLQTHLRNIHGKMQRF